MQEPAAGSRRFTARQLHGILLPCPTPFDAGDQVDTRALASNLKHWNETGISGHVILGSTGERAHLDERESLAVVRAAREAVSSQLSFIVGVGQHGTRASIAEARRAAEAGADALLVITPHFYRSAMTNAALIAHYTAIADAAPAPLILYNIPQSTGVSLAPETVAHLAAHDNIIGIKDSSGDMINFLELLRVSLSEQFAVLTGHAAILYAALSAGAPGAILAAACVAPHLAVGICEAVEQGDHERAAGLQRKLIPLARAVTVRYGIGGLKHALDLVGYAGGDVRAPLHAPDAEAKREIARLLAECGLPVEKNETQLAEGAATT